MSVSAHGQDLRKSERVPIRVDLLYAVNKPAEIRLHLGRGEHCGAMVDISAEGIGFVSEIAIPVSTELEIKFHLIYEESVKSSMFVYGQVRYCRSLVEFGRYRIGVEFTNIKQEDRDIIKGFVRKCL